MLEHLDEFSVLSGFRFLEAYTQMGNCSDGTKVEITTLRFYNDKSVGIDIEIIDGELSLSEPYAINSDFEPVNGGSK